MAVFLSLPWAAWWDRRSLTTRVVYDFDAFGAEVHEGVVRIIEDLQRSHRVWSVRTEDSHGDWKRNAGAGVSVDRSVVRVGWGAPPRLLTNVRIGHIQVARYSIYFFPDRLLIYGAGGIQAVPYADLDFQPAVVDFIEEGGVPGDAVRVGTTWKFVNRDGGPDRRFKDNRQLAVMKYDVLNLTSSGGVRLKLQISKAGLAEKATGNLGVIKQAIEELEARGVPIGSVSGTAGIADDLPPLAAPATKAVRVGIAALEYRWLSALPEWAVPVVWGLIFALPLVALLVLFANGQSTGAWTFLGMALLLSGAGIPVLARERRGLLAARAAEEKQERMDRFRDALRDAFRSKPAGQVDVQLLAAESGVTQEEADEVIDELYRRRSAKTLVDGVMSTDDQRKVRLLAKALRISSDRRARLEAEAGCVGYGETAAPAVPRTTPQAIPPGPPANDNKQPVTPPPPIELEEPQPPNRRRTEARVTAAPAPELSLDFDKPGGSTPIAPDFDFGEKSPPPAAASQPARPRQPSAAEIAALYGTPALAPTLDRASIPPARTEIRDRRVDEVRDRSELIEVAGWNPPPDSGEAIPRRVPLEARPPQRPDPPGEHHDTFRPLWAPPGFLAARPESSVMTWHGKGRSVCVGAYTLTDPLVYVSDGQAGSGEASCIDRRLEVGKPVAEPPGRLGYYPEYSRISKEQRANYLQWLSGGRSSPLADIGYAFLFFYGLERRLLVEDQDLSPIVKEVVRLLEGYTFSGSFDGYLSRFLSYTLARTGIGTLKEKWFQAVFERTRAQRDEQHLAVGLAWLFSNDRPLPAGWARRIARLDPRSPRSVVLERLPDQFNALFLKRYKDRYGDGMKLTAAKRHREVTYQPASPSWRAYDTQAGALKPVTIPHVMGIQSQFAPLVKIWTSCVEELKPLSRVMARGADVSDRAAYEALPEALKAETEHPDKSPWEKVAAERAGEDGTVLVKIAALAEIQGYPEKAKLTAKQSEALAQTAHAVGFMIEPDPRITGRAYSWEDHAVLFRPEDRPSLPQGCHYGGAALLLELGMFIAAADGEVEEDEVNHIVSFLESQFLLDPADARRLEALKRVFSHQQPSIAGIGKRLQKIADAQQVESIGQFLFGVAAVNGAIEKAEIGALRSAYRALGIAPKTLDRQLDEYRRLEKEPIEVAPGEGREGGGETLPTRRADAPRTSYTLDKSLIALLMRETDQVRAILGEAMGEEQAAATAGVIPQRGPEPPHSDPRFAGLDDRHSAVLTLLCGRTSWARAEFDELVRRHSLMAAGALDKINEWAYEKFEDPVLEEDEGSVRVHSHILAEPS